MTNSSQLPSTEGRGYMNRANYEKFAEPFAPVSSTVYTNTYNFTLPPSSTGFYIAIQDTGSCISLVRLRIFRNNCVSRQVGLILYPNTPAPVSGVEFASVSCVENAEISGSPLVSCSSDGIWQLQSPVCQCNPGYADNMTGICVGKSFQLYILGTKK